MGGRRVGGALEAVVFRGGVGLPIHALQCETDAEEDKAREIISQWGERLSEISWYMRCLNEYTAREANKEDGCKERLWVGPFKSQALLEENALLALIAYMDLNPIRAEFCEMPGESAHTPIQERVQAFMFSPERAGQEGQGPLRESEKAVSANIAAGKDKAMPAAPLAAFTGIPGHVNRGLPFHFSDYLELVE